MTTPTKKIMGIFYIEKNKAYYFAENLPSLLMLPFPPDIFSDLEVVSRKKLEGLITAFIESYNIAAIDVIIILSPSVAFEKDFKVTSDPQPDIQKFLELVPFEDVVNKQFIAGENTKVVAVNKELLDITTIAFTQRQFNVRGAYPFSFFKLLLPQLTGTIDFNLILTKVDEMQKYNFLKIVELPPVSILAPPQKKTRLYVLVGVMAFLLLVLFFMIYTTYFARKSFQKILPTPRIVPSASSSATVGR